jgi:hypothetical protein
MSNESYSRSAGNAALRGAALLLITLGVGVYLVHTKSNNAAPSSPKTTKSPDTTVPVAADSGVPAVIDPALVASTTLPVRSPAMVKVLVVNGSGVNRAAARVRAFLAPARYDLKVPADGAKKNFDDLVYFNPGFEAEARDIAAKLSLVGTVDKPRVSQTAPDLVKPPVPDFDVLVMVGPDMAVRFKNQALTSGGASTPPASTKKPVA